jgi:isoprenylcysteine carboxyl methyltransferase (ICMT) family protein YpbQ
MRLRIQGAKRFGKEDNRELALYLTGVFWLSSVWYPFLYGSLMRFLVIVLFLALFAASACSKQEVVDSIGHGLKKSCQDNPGRCTVYDEDKARK